MWGVRERAVTFQSMSRTSSPARYSRTSENDMPRPRRVILSGEDFVGKPPGFDLDLADSFQDIVFGLLHYCIFN